MNDTLTQNEQCLTWAEMIRIEPRLHDLLQQARREAHRFASVWPHYSQLKRKLSDLAGWKAARPELRTSEAFEIGCQRLIDCLEGRD